MSVYLKIQVTIRTTKGEFVRESGTYQVPSAGASNVQVNGGVLTYPDLRATEFRILTSPTGAAPWVVALVNPGDERAIFPATRSVVNNMAYAILPGSIDTTIYPNPFILGKTTTGPGTGDVDRDPNRIIHTETAQLHAIPAASALYASGSEEDQIMRFEANTRPVSEGQFGFAPLLVLSRSSVQALEVGESGSFVNVVPLADRGCVGRYAATNANGTIVMVSADGVWTLRPQLADSPISLVLHSFDSGDDILDDLSGDVAATYVDDGRGNREVRIGTPNKTYCYSLEYRRWFTLTRARGVQLRDEERMLAYDSIENDITEELQTVDVGLLRPAGVEYRLATATYKLGAPGTTKRFYRIAVRQRGEMDELRYEVYDPLDQNNIGGPIDSAITAPDTGALAVYVDSVEVDGAGELVTGEPTYVISQEEGALVAAGFFHRNGDTDSVSLEYSVARDVYVIITGKGKPGQGIEGIEFDYEPRYMHRARRRNYRATH